MNDDITYRTVRVTEEISLVDICKRYDDSAITDMVDKIAHAIKCHRADLLANVANATITDIHFRDDYDYTDGDFEGSGETLVCVAYQRPESDKERDARIDQKLEQFKRRKKNLEDSVQYSRLQALEAKKKLKRFDSPKFLAERGTGERDRLQKEFEQHRKEETDLRTRIVLDDQERDVLIATRNI